MECYDRFSIAFEIIIPMSKIHHFVKLRCLRYARTLLSKLGSKNRTLFDIKMCPKLMLSSKVIDCGYSLHHVAVILVAGKTKLITIGSIS